jgi:hypothetical protein
VFAPKFTASQFKKEIESLGAIAKKRCPKAEAEFFG